MINVMIIDDNEALRLGLRIFVEEESDMWVVGECWHVDAQRLCPLKCQGKMSSK